jgi:dTDP-glucose 4,6-dehydratase
VKTILVTGGAGFIGKHFIKLILDKYPSYFVINLDKMTYAADSSVNSLFKANNRYRFIMGDICDQKLVDSVFDDYIIDYIVNFAAESHVDKSIENPKLFMLTNILGTEVLLRAAHTKWSKEDLKNHRFVQISTDEVYGSLGSTGSFNEISPIKPSSPYSASKASADLIALSYYKTYGLPVIITRCSNNYGPGQYPEKLIPLMIKNALENISLPLYGSGNQIRDWIHVKDHCRAIDTVLHFGVIGEVYNIGSNNELTNIQLVKMILRLTQKPESLIVHVSDRLGHDIRYSVNSEKIQSELNWKPTIEFENGLLELINEQFSKVKS